MSIARKMNNGLGLVGIDLRRTWRAAVGVPRFLRDVQRYRSQQTAQNFRFQWREAKPFLCDFTEPAGQATGHYFFQDLWAARKVFAWRPERHVDVGSRIDGFVAHLLSFMPVEVIDIRPLESRVPGLTFVQSDAANLLNVADGSLHSLSSLHAVEHFGLGRYSDPVDPNACFSAMHALERVLAPGGRLYFSVPVGRERVEFNAHRVFSPNTVIQTFARLTLRSFSAVTDTDDFLEDIEPRQVAGSRFACGMFEFERT